jgi:phosphotransferase system enzyme I (PtsI)
MLQDSTLTSAPVALIRERQCNAEWALKTQRDRLVKVFDEMDDPYLRTRRVDVVHVINRIMWVLVKGADSETETKDVRLDGRVVVTDDLTPADTVLMQHQGIVAFVTEFGGPLSHTAILARNLGIPAVIGARGARRYLRDEESVVVDGEQGLVLSAEDSLISEHYLRKQRERRRERTRLASLRTAPSITRDGVNVSLQANIELSEDVQHALEAGAEGVGLYRTEFLFMNRAVPPTEEEQFREYKRVVKDLKGRPITIRTLDLGADKQVDGGRGQGPLGSNPALGLRAIRLCLKDLELFRPQLRALLRAGAEGPIRIMVPMLSSLHEMYQVLAAVEEVSHQLTEQGIAFGSRVPIGGMIEVPAAAICAELFAKHLRFLSIGTNDLIQYTLAIDRVDDEVNYLYDPLHPAILRLIHGTIEAGRRRRIPVSLCGEMAGDPRYARLLLGLGLTEFSMHPSALLEVKKIIRDSDAAELRGLVRRVLRCRDPDRLPQLLEGIAS